MRVADTLGFVESLSRKNFDAIGFIPAPRLEQYVDSGQILVELENDEPCGFLVHGAGAKVMRIYQACIQYDARRRTHGFALISRLIKKAVASNCEAIALRCASDLEANDFWRECGFICVRSVPGGERRGRIINVWFQALPNTQGALF